MGDEHRRIRSTISCMARYDVALADFIADNGRDPTENERQRMALEIIICAATSDTSTGDPARAAEVEGEDPQASS